MFIPGSCYELLHSDIKEVNKSKLYDSGTGPLQY